MGKRQVVFIMTDSQGTNLVGCYGNRDIKTPNIDKLADEGMRFNRAYTVQPVCGPARSALFTGTYPHSNGSWSNCMPLGANVKTIGQRLSDNGIHTAYIGKWHLDGGDYFGLGRCPDGWDKDYWYDMRCYLEELSSEDRKWSRTPAIMEKREVEEGFTFGHRCSNRAIDFMSKYNEEDFFLVVSYDEPHGPFVCPAPFSSMYKGYEYPKHKNIWDDLRDKPEHQRVWAGGSLDGDKDKLKIQPAYYLGCNSYIDYEIGRVLDAVEKYAPDALIIYTSDHGDMLFSHSLNGKGPVMYDEITNIPLIVKWRGMVEEGCVCEHPVSHINLVPTIMETMKLPKSKAFEGGSILPTLMDKDVRCNDAIFMEFGRYEVDHDGFGGFQPARAVFDGRYKLVINLLTSDELYDLEKDPGELENLIDSKEYDEIRDRLHDRLLDWMNDTRDPFRGYYWERRPWRKDARPATWDYTGMTRQRKTDDEYEPRQLDYSTGLEIENSVRKK